jgi:hypothetical protein
VSITAAPPSAVRAFDVAEAVLAVDLERLRMDADELHVAPDVLALAIGRRLAEEVLDVRGQREAIERAIRRRDAERRRATIYSTCRCGVRGTERAPLRQLVPTGAYLCASCLEGRTR